VELGDSISLSFGIPMAARQETMKGGVSFGFCFAYEIRKSTICLTSLNTSLA
jgi:hypothetical protein